MSTTSSVASDYLFCGTCFLSFRLCDITVFIEHKRHKCTPNLTDPDATHTRNSAANNLVATLLECVQCFQKFPTAWPLLMHVQFEHQLLLANTVQQRQPSLSDPDKGYIVSSTRGLNPNSTVQEPSECSDSTLLTPIPVELTSTGTQTRLSSFGSQLIPYHRKFMYPSCCVSGSSENKCEFTANQVDHVVDHHLSSFACPCTNQSVQPNSLELPSIPLSGICSPCERGAGSHSIPSSNFVCCVSPLHKSSRNSDAGNDAPPESCACCPCTQPPRTRSDLINSESQTDFEPMFNSSDYADIAMLLTSPSWMGSKSPGIDLDSFFKLENSKQLETTVDDTNLDGQITSLPDPDQIVMQPSIDNVVSDAPSASLFSADSSSITADTNTQVVPTTPIVSGLPTNQSDGLHFAVTDASQTGTGTSRCDSVAGRRMPPNSSSSLRFTCTHCGSIYNQKVHLKKHIMTQHIRKKPFECHLCRYSTVEKSHLTVHLRTHTGERPFQCRVCQYSSTQNCTLKSHYFRKHPADFIHCNNCSTRFYTEQELSRHTRTCLIYR